ncbi:hypothetical protein ABZ445_16365 [Streptomyces chartreusis]|uniref:hypothetical protein n=1 Tax=Streptomyces chartreusis TaxID=1969 RepID=UPI0033F10BD5
MSATVFDQQNDGYADVYEHEGRVVLDVNEGPHAQHFDPFHARALAAALLRAADEAEGREPVGAERNLLDFIDRAGWDGTALVSAHRQYVRDEVAAELETLPRYNDVADWCANIGRRQAIETARRGRRP